MKKVPGQFRVAESHSPPPHYDRQPTYQTMKQERDVLVAMRDGVHLCIDIYRPDTQEKFPALLAFGPHNKDLQTPEACENSGPQPAWSPFWLGGQEAGDTRYFVSRGYAHVIGYMRGNGKSEGGGSPKWDLYDLIEWIAQQPWCDGNVGMIGISAFAGQQWQAAMQQPPHLKAIFPYDAFAAYPFRDRNPGGVLHTMQFHTDPLGVYHLNRGVPPKTLPADKERLWKEAMDNPDYRMYGPLYNILTMKGLHYPRVYETLVDPYEDPKAVEVSEANFDKIKVPAYTGVGWYAYTYKVHFQGAQNWFNGIKVPKKLLFTGLAHLERPFHSFHDEILRWHDYWLKGINTGVLDEPPVKFWVNGANAWYYGDSWPLPETTWEKFYLESWERLRQEPFIASSRGGIEQPDSFVQMPPTQTRTVQKLRFMTDPLSEDTMVVGPSSLHLYASIDQEDTNWIVILKDVGPDSSVRTAREGETAIPSNLPEVELSRGWLKASHRALDPKRTKPWRPWHLLTREAQKPVVPGEVTEYDIEILSTANLFKRGHRICIEITSMDMPTGTAGFTNVEYIAWHVCSSKTTLHKIYHNEKYPSYLLLPIIPKVDPE